MSNTDFVTIVSEHEPSRSTFKSYVTGFVLSLGLTLTAYILTIRHSLSSHMIIGIIIALALVQFLVQLYFFLHLGRETKPRWKMMVFFFMLLVVLILVFGSLWIMNNLNTRMTPAQMNDYMTHQDGGI